MNDIQHTKVEMLVRTLRQGADLHATPEGTYVRFEERNGSHLLRTMLVHEAPGETVADVIKDIAAICSDNGVQLKF